MSFELFGRTWERDEADQNVLRSGSASVNLVALTGRATLHGEEYPLKGRGFRALEMEVRATQDTDPEITNWLYGLNKGYQVEYGPKGVVISTKNDMYGNSLTFRASGKTLSAALKDLARRRRPTPTSQEKTPPELEKIIMEVKQERE